jgi:hypothetical protein
MFVGDFALGRTIPPLVAHRPEPCPVRRTGLLLLPRGGSWTGTALTELGPNGAQSSLCKGCRAFASAKGYNRPSSTRMMMITRTRPMPPEG